LVQLEEYVAPKEIFREFAYFSSFSGAWLEHAKNYVAMITDKLKIDERSQIVGAGSNNGYLLQYFVQTGIPVLGVEPTTNVDEAAIKKSFLLLLSFLGKTAKELGTKKKHANLLIGNSVLAQVPNLNEFTEV
jgi:hypothetical protein